MVLVPEKCGYSHCKSCGEQHTLLVDEHTGVQNRISAAALAKQVDEAQGLHRRTVSELDEALPASGHPTEGPPPAERKVVDDHTEEVQWQTLHALRWVRHGVVSVISPGVPVDANHRDWCLRIVDFVWSTYEVVDVWGGGGGLQEGTVPHPVTAGGNTTNGSCMGMFPRESFNAHWAQKKVLVFRYR